jgi:hypothetical protein
MGVTERLARACSRRPWWTIGSWIGALVLALVAMVLAAGLGAVARGVLGGARWARSPALVWQLLQALVSASITPRAVGVLLVMLALAVAVGLFRDDVIQRES